MFDRDYIDGPNQIAWGLLCLGFVVFVASELAGCGPTIQQPEHTQPNSPVAEQSCERHDTAVFVNSANGKVSIGGGNVLVDPSTGKVKFGPQTDDVFIDTDGHVHVGL